jgi:hypothetical protein
MDEREAARDGGLPARKILGTSFEMAGTGFRYRRDDSPPVTLLQAPSKSIAFLRKYPVAVVSKSTDQHAVSIAVKSVACLNSVVVGGEDSFPSCKCADQR